MSKIDQVELYAFTFDVKYLGLGSHLAAGVGNVIYKRGATFKAERFAVRILCDDGASGKGLGPMRVAKVQRVDLVNRP